MRAVHAERDAVINVTPAAAGRRRGRRARPLHPGVWRRERRRWNGSQREPEWKPVCCRASWRRCRLMVVVLVVALRVMVVVVGSQRCTHRRAACGKRIERVSQRRRDGKRRRRSRECSSLRRTCARTVPSKAACGGVQTSARARRPTVVTAAAAALVGSRPRGSGRAICNAGRQRTCTRRLCVHVVGRSVVVRRSLPLLRRRHKRDVAHAAEQRGKRELRAAGAACSAGGHVGGVRKRCWWPRCRRRRCMQRGDWGGRRRASHCRAIWQGATRMMVVVVVPVVMMVVVAGATSYRSCKTR